MTYDDAVHIEPPSRDGRSDQFRFSHGDGVVRNRAGRISSTTRYLSGAAYVDEEYAEKVVDELVASSHRAVAPSLGYDVTTVIRHCFRAQRLWLVQNAVITAILVLGLIFFTWATLTVFVLCVLGSLVIPETPRASKWPTWKVVAVIVAVIAVLGCLVGPLTTILQTLGTGSFGSSTFDSSTFGGGAPVIGGGNVGATVGKFVGGFAVVAVAVLVTLIWSRHRMITTIASDLARGRADGPPRPGSREVEQRLRVIETAQHGNIVLHAGYEPFVGAGVRLNAWSIATELRPDEDSGPH
jgi:hypothetical protein